MLVFLKDTLGIDADKYRTILDLLNVKTFKSGLRSSL